MRNVLMATAVVFALLAGACAHMESGHAGHGGPSGIPVYAEKVNWHDLDEGRKMALSMKKPIIVDFAVPSGCDRCDFLQDNVYSDDDIVAKINADFVPIWVNLDASSHTLTPEEERLGQKFEYRKDCILLFLDHQERLIEDPDGKQFCFVEEVEPEDFITYLEYVKTKYIPAN